jgi:hypothetical protein
MTEPATQMLPEDIQRSNEYLLSKKHIHRWIDKAIRDDPEMEAMVFDAVARLEEWIAEDHYPSKQLRLVQLKQLDLEQLVRDIFIRTAYFQKPELFVSVTSQLAVHLQFDERSDSARTIAEVCAVICWAGAFSITKASDDASLMLVNNLDLPEDLLTAIRRSLYLPPMVCEPGIVQSNYESAYLTHNDSLILGKGNSHAGDICLDVINTQNQVALQLDTDFLSSVEEEPTHELETLEQKQQWDQFKYDSYCVYTMLAEQGNRFWLTNKVDKRGRLYCQGYHATSQGSAFKKSMIELADAEVVTGVPSCIKIAS